MDTSPHSTSSTIRESGVYEPVEQEDDVEEAEPHIHLPNPSYWPVYLSFFIAVAIAGFLFISSVPWISIIALVGVLICILGWGLEDPMAPMKETYITIRQKFDPWKFKIGQEVMDSQGQSLGKVQARFPNYFLVERAGLFSKVYYVPQGAAKDEMRNNTIYLTMSEADLQRMGLSSVPHDLYDETPEHGFPVVRGAAQFARRPLSPAETGHYNYGRRSPGINTDASGSYHRQEVLPTPQDYVTEGVYSTDKQIPPRNLNPD
jgi:hypothetical protein